MPGVLLGGQPDELAFLLVSTSIDAQAISPYTGVLFPVGAAPVALGTVPPSGTTALDVPLPPLPPGMEHLVLHGQARFVDASTGKARLSNPSSLVWL